MSTVETNYEFEKELCRTILKQMAAAPDGSPLVFNASPKKAPESQFSLSPRQVDEWAKWRYRVSGVLHVAKLLDKTKDYQYVINTSGREFLEKPQDEQDLLLDEMWKIFDSDNHKFTTVGTQQFVGALREWIHGPHAGKRSFRNVQRILAELYDLEKPTWISSLMPMIAPDVENQQLAEKNLDNHLGRILLGILKLPERPYYAKRSVFYRDGLLVPNFRAALKILDDEGSESGVDLKEWKKNTITPPDSKEKGRENITKHVEVPTMKIPKKTILEQITEILEHKSQVIFFGPPGTGKTYIANEYLKSIFNGLSKDGDFQSLSYETWDEKYVRRCTFHPEYGYEHFIEGFRPQKDDAGKHTGFELKDGIFKELCKAADTDWKKTKDKEKAPKYYLIIDEINRGDIPRIFGELITLIETDKRSPEKGTYLPHSGKEKGKFHAPPNVYIIATMNTADRSIALLDTALRRRFGFLEMKPDSDAFGSNETELSINGKTIRLKEWFDKLNNDILLPALGDKHDAKHILIGHSFFMPVDKLNEDKFKFVIRYEIIPLVEEYCYENPDALKKILDHIRDTTGISVDDKPKFSNEASQPIDEDTDQEDDDSDFDDDDSEDEE